MSEDLDRALEYLRASMRLTAAHFELGSLAADNGSNNASWRFRHEAPGSADCMIDAARAQKAWDRGQMCRANRKAWQHDWVASIKSTAINHDGIQVVFL